jgi:hypothetical protein
MERLDRATTNIEWHAMFPDMEVSVLAKRSSDHHPILVCFNEKRGLVWRKKKHFIMEERWCVREDYKQVVHAAWTARRRAVNPWKNISGKLDSCQKATKMWVKKTVHVNEALIAAKTRELTVIQQGEIDPDKRAEADLQVEIHSLLEHEELKWKQHAKEDWLRNGDCNTKYYHACASKKKKEKHR